MKKHCNKYCDTCRADQAPDTEDPRYCHACLRRFTDGAPLLDADGVRVWATGEAGTFPCAVCGEARALKMSLACGRCAQPDNKLKEKEKEVDDMQPSVHHGVVRVFFDGGILEFKRQGDFGVRAKPKVVRGKWTDQRVKAAYTLAHAALDEHAYSTR